MRSHANMSSKLSKDINSLRVIESLKLSSQRQDFLIDSLCEARTEYLMTGWNSFILFSLHKPISNLIILKTKN